MRDQDVEDISFEYTEVIREATQDFLFEKWKQHPNERGLVVKAVFSGAFVLLTTVARKAIRGTDKQAIRVLNALVDTIYACGLKLVRIVDWENDDNTGRDLFRDLYSDN